MTNKENVYQKKFCVSKEHADAQGRMTPGAIAREMGNLFMEQREAFGLGTQLMDMGLLWVLVRTAIQAERLPKVGEDVLLRTWPGEEKRWMYPQRYEFVSRAGERLVGAASQWVLMDAKTRRLADPTRLPDPVPVVSLPDEPELPAKRVIFPKELSMETMRAVKPEETDMNGHMNNSCYLDWAMELLSGDYFENHVLSSLWVEYCLELREGQLADLRWIMEEDILFLRGYLKEKESFLLKVNYREI